MSSPPDDWFRAKIRALVDALRRLPADRRDLALEQLEDPDGQPDATNGATGAPETSTHREGSQGAPRGTRRS